MQPVEQFAVALSTVQAELDWDLLGKLYCYEGGESFFEDEQRSALTDAGLKIASDLAGVVEHKGASHYIGAAVAEIPMMLCEQTVMGRQVHWTLLPGPEFNELERAMKIAGGPLPQPPSAPPTEINHLWCVSVLTDPEAFPGLHDELYERDGLGGDPVADRAQALELVRDLLGPIGKRSVLSTTDEEAPLFLAELERMGWKANSPRKGRTTPIVGDVVRHYRVKQ